MEIKQYMLKQQIDHRGKSQGKVENTLRQVKMKIQHIKTYGT